MKKFKRKKRVAIIGGGITGLAAAYYLQKRIADYPIDWILIEEANRLGGRIYTEKHDDFQVEEGPDSFITFKPWALDLCKELGLSKELISPSNTQFPTWIFQNGKTSPFPRGIFYSSPSFLELLATNLLSWRGKFRLFMEPLIPAKSVEKDETLGSFIRRRMGNEVLEKMAGPLLAGIHAADPEKMSLLNSYPALARMERASGSLLKGHRKMTSSGSPVFLTLKGGLSSLVERINSFLPQEKIMLRSKLALIKKKKNKYKIIFENATGLSEIDADYVLLTIPAKQASKPLLPLSSDLCKELRKIRSTSTINVYLGFSSMIKIKKYFKGHGLLIPNKENRHVSACSWTSLKFANRATHDNVLIRVFLGRDGKEEINKFSDDEIVSYVTNQLYELVGINEIPKFIKINRMHNAHPQYDLNHHRRISSIESYCPSGLYLAGSSYYGTGIPDCIRQGKESVEKILNHYAN